MKDDDRSLVDAVLASIDGGIFDHYLKAIVDAAIMRKRKVTEETGRTPAQFRVVLTPKPPDLDAVDDAETDEELIQITEEELAAMTRSEVRKIARSQGVAVTPDMTKDDIIDAIFDAVEESAAFTGAASIKATTVSSATTQSWQQSGPLGGRPSLSAPEFTGRVYPLTTPQFQRLGEEHTFTYGKYHYEKREFYRKVLQVGHLFGVSDVRVMVIGVKNKVKVLLVNEPPKGTLMGEDPHTKWVANEELYLDKSILSPWLDGPPVGQENDYLA